MNCFWFYVGGEGRISRDGSGRLGRSGWGFREVMGRMDGGGRGGEYVFDFLDSLECVL